MGYFSKWFTIFFSYFRRYKKPRMKLRSNKRTARSVGYGHLLLLALESSRNAKITVRDVATSHYAAPVVRVYYYYRCLLSAPRESAAVPYYC